MTLIVIKGGIKMSKNYYEYKDYKYKDDCEYEDYEYRDYRYKDRDRDCVKCKPPGHPLPKPIIMACGQGNGFTFADNGESISQQLNLNLN